MCTGHDATQQVVTGRILGCHSNFGES